MKRESCIVARGPGFALHRMGRDRARELTDFVYETYFERFQDRYGSLAHDDYVAMAIEDLFTLNRSTIFAAISDQTGLILGSIRIIERSAALPAEKEFGFDALEQFQRHFGPGGRVNRIFEIGRFATCARNLAAAGLRKGTSLKITDLLLKHMFASIAAEADNLTVAALDVTTLRILKMRGIHFRVIDRPRDYLGSPTVPVLLPVDLCFAEMRRTHPARYDFFRAHARGASLASA